jgi:hypothetical protein
MLWIEDWHALRLLIVVGLSLGLLAIAVIGGLVATRTRGKPPRKSLPRIDSPAVWQSDRGDERRAA